MPYRIVIQFAAASDVHRVRNFGEDLFRSLPRIDGSLPLDEVDAAVDRLEITSIHPRKLKRLLNHTGKLLSEHNLSAEVHTVHSALPPPAAGSRN